MSLWSDIVSPYTAALIQFIDVCEQEGGISKTDIESIIEAYKLRLNDLNSPDNHSAKQALSNAVCLWLDEHTGHPVDNGIMETPVFLNERSQNQRLKDYYGGKYDSDIEFIENHSNRTDDNGLAQWFEQNCKSY